MRRVVAVLAAVLAALAVWGVARLAGADVETVRKSGDLVDLPALYVAVVALLCGLGGWALLALLERFTPARARRLWLAAAAAVLTVALVHTAVEWQLTIGQRLWLAVMCLAVAGVLVPLLPRPVR